MGTTTTISDERLTRDSHGGLSDSMTMRELNRIRSEYIEMPGLVLTVPQAARLWGLNVRRSERLLSVLVDSGFLSCDKNIYRRRR